MTFLKHILQAMEKLVARLGKNRVVLITGFTICYAVVTYLLASRKDLWNDELYTYYIAKLPSMTEVWKALMSGGEQTPPFFYLLTRASISLLGLNSFALRLPEMIGFWIMCVCLFLLVARRTSNCYALLASIFPLITYTYYYAYEARPYGLVLGFGTLAFLCWQGVIMNRFRLLSIIGLSISLAAALSSHYYGVFAIFPLALGETVRSIVRRRLDVPVWAAFAFAILPLAWHLPLILEARSYSVGFWAKAQWMDIPTFYINMLSTVAVPLIVLLFFSVIYQIVWADKKPDANRTSPMYELPVFEITAALGFIIIPVICVILGKFVTGAFVDRYAITAIIGFSVLVPLMAAKLNNNNSLISTLLVICFVGWFGLLALKHTWKLDIIPPEAKIQLLKRKDVKNLPIVAADPYTFIDLNYYAPDLTSRVVYLADPEISFRRLRTNSVERGMVDLLKPWFRLNVTDYKSYILRQPQFLLCGDPTFFSWIVPQLEEDGFKLELKGLDGKLMLFIVSSPSFRNNNGILF